MGRASARRVLLTRDGLKLPRVPKVREQHSLSTLSSSSPPLVYPVWGLQLLWMPGYWDKEKAHTPGAIPPEKCLQAFGGSRNSPLPLIWGPWLLGILPLNSPAESAAPLLSPPTSWRLVSKNHAPPSSASSLAPAALL